MRSSTHLKQPHAASTAIVPVRVNSRSDAARAIAPAANAACKSAASSKAPRSSTGSRTHPGKESAKYNALKHGVFSKVVLLKGESKRQFDSLFRGLRDDFQPQGALEELLVEKLVTLLWRYRRLILAERAQIEGATKFLVWENQLGQINQAAECTRPGLFSHEPSPIAKIENPVILSRCLDILDELRENILEDGFNVELDRSLLEKIYGSYDEDLLQEMLPAIYESWLFTSNAPAEERELKGFASPEECKKMILRAIDAEIRRLERFEKQQSAVQSARMKLEALRRRVPDSPAADRLNRYEASLERAFDRTLNQLERAQRLRKGQFVPPPLKLEVTSP